MFKYHLYPTRVPLLVVLFEYFFPKLTKGVSTLRILLLLASTQPTNTHSSLLVIHQRSGLLTHIHLLAPLS